MAFIIEVVGEERSKGYAPMAEAPNITATTVLERAIQVSPCSVRRRAASLPAVARAGPQVNSASRPDTADGVAADVRIHAQERKRALGMPHVTFGWGLGGGRDSARARSVSASDDALHARLAKGHCHKCRCATRAKVQRPEGEQSAAASLVRIRHHLHTPSTK